MSRGRRDAANCARLAGGMTQDGDATKPPRAAKLRLALGFLVAPLSVAVLLPGYAHVTDATVTAGFVTFAVTVGYLAAMLLGLPLHLLLLGRGRDRGAGAYAVAGAAVGLAAYALIIAFLSIHHIVELALAEVLYVFYLSRPFALVGLACGAVSGIVFWLIAVRG